MQEPLEFIECLALARTGETKALGRLLHDYRGYLLTIANQELTSDLQAKIGASDLVQETFVDAHRDFDRFAGSDEIELKAWLRRILLNNLANFTRGFRETQRRDVTREIPLDGGEVALDQSTPSGHVMGQERAAEMLQAIQRLPEDYRQILRLRHEENRSFEEIAEVMGRSLNAVQKLWMRTIERLQQDLDGAK